MEDISNKTLALLLVVAILTSVGGLMLSVNKLNQLQFGMPGITGAATSTGTGRVNVSIGGVTSINVTDTSLQFGTCNPNPGGGSTFTSNSTINGVDTPVNSYNCTMTTADNLTIKNIGNTDVNLTVTFGTNGSFIGGLNPQLWFDSDNDFNAEGCQANYNNLNMSCTTESNCSTTVSWFEITYATKTTNNKVCLNLSKAQNNNSVIVWAKIFVPADAPVSTGLNTTASFTGTSIP